MHRSQTVLPRDAVLMRTKGRPRVEFSILWPTFQYSMATPRDANNKIL
jgi:hypothetical protein